MSKDKKYYDDFFSEHGPDVHFDPVRFSEIAKLCKGSVLDIGCGTGNLADFYSGPYSGVDISEVAIKYAKELRPKTASFFVADLTENIKEEGKKYDTIVMAEFLEHLDKDETLWFNIMKLSKPDTRLIVSLPNSDRVPDESHFRTFTVPQLRSLFSKLGSVKFYNWAGFRARILLTCDLGKKSENLLSLSIIAKNEGKGLENAILSCIEFVDNIVIAVDNSSNDSTLSIAKIYADDLRIYDWEGSFCKARNFAQKGVQTKWILHLDGHEFVAEKGSLDIALKKDCDSFFIRVTLENGFTFYFPRLVRNFVKWERDVHNFPSVKDSVRLGDFLIRHDRQGLQSKEGIEIRDRQRELMITEIMGKALKENKRDIRALFYLAQQHHYHKRFKQAIKFYKRYLRYSKNHEERWLVFWEMAMIHNLRGQHIRALLRLNKAEKELPGRWETLHFFAVTWAMIGKARTAIDYFVASISENKESHMYNPIKKDMAQIYDSVGACFFSLRKYTEAKIAWRTALDFEREKPEKEKNLNRIKILEKMVQG